MLALSEVDHARMSGHDVLTQGLGWVAGASREVSRSRFRCTVLGGAVVAPIGPAAGIGPLRNRPPLPAGPLMPPDLASPSCTSIAGDAYLCHVRPAPAPGSPAATPALTWPRAAPPDR